MPVDSAGTAITVGASVTLTGKVTALPPDKTLTGVTAANPGVFTISGGHSFKNGQKVQIKGVAGMLGINNVVGKIAGATSTTFRLIESTQEAKAISGATKANPCVLTVTGHGLTAGTLIYITGVGGMVEITDGLYMVGTVADANSFGLKTSAGAAVNSTAYTTYTSGGYVSNQRTAATAKTISGITSATPGVVTCTAHGFSDGDYVQIDGVKGMSEVNGHIYKVDDAATNTFSLDTSADVDVSTTGFGGYESGGVARKLMSTAVQAAYTSGGVVAPYEGGRIDDNVEVEIDGVGGRTKVTVRGANLTI